MHSFTPVASLLGGILIGLASGLLWLSGGQIAGISGIVGGLLSRWGQATLWRVAFVAGMLVAAIALQAAWPGAFALAGLPSLGVTALGGLLVGVGTRLGNGCTSGHGVCGMGRGSVRSLAATLTFVLAGVSTVFLMYQLLGREG
jgi:uncharacterized membrane protein YedE/YeeE